MLYICWCSSRKEKKKKKKKKKRGNVGGLTFPCSPSLMPSALSCLGARFLSLPPSLAQTLFSLRLLDFWTPPPPCLNPPAALSKETSAPVNSLTRERLVFTLFSCRKEKVSAAKNVHLCIRSEFKITLCFLWCQQDRFTYWWCILTFLLSLLLFFKPIFVLNLVPYSLRRGERPALLEKNYNSGTRLSYFTQFLRKKKKRGAAKDFAKTDTFCSVNSIPSGLSCQTNVRVRRTHRYRQRCRMQMNTSGRKWEDGGRITGDEKWDKTTVAAAAAREDGGAGTRDGRECARLGILSGHTHRFTWGHTHTHTHTCKCTYIRTLD